MQRMTGCPDCQVAVPVGRWCNRCGAPLAVAHVAARRGVPTPRGRLLVTIGVSLALALAAVRGVTVADNLRDRGAAGRIEVPVASDLRDPPFVEYRTVVMATVVCSSIELRRVPVAQIGPAEVGEFVRLPVGDCVVHARPRAGRAGVGTASLAR